MNLNKTRKQNGEMKGLQQFILDLRSSKTNEDQNKRINLEIINIQKQFSSNDKLNGYQRKKYIAKIIYIYLTLSCNPNAIDFAFSLNQILQLISSKVYSEKFMGYLAISLINNNDDINSDNKDFTILIINSLKKDLSSNDINLILLSLSCISSLSNNEIWSDLLVEDVFQLLRSPTSSSIIKKKSALTFLKLFKLNKSILVKNSQWISRILSIIDDKELGVVLSIIPLIQLIALEIDYEKVQILIPTLTQLLNSLILDNSSIKDEYFFGNIANPWLIIKIVDLLKILIPDVNNKNLDVTNLRTLRQCVSKTIELTTIERKSTDISIKNAQNSVLFSMISFATHLDPSKEALNSSIDALVKLLDSHETNTRYLSLNSIILTLNENNLNKNLNIERNLKTFFHLLRDNDVSISKKALDLIYKLTNSSNNEFIIDELLKILKKSDHVLKSEITIKISVLAERFAKDPLWFVNTMLELIEISGANLNESIWERIVQIVVNNENLQPFTCKQLMKKATNNHTVMTEPMVKITSYLLGEFGYLIINDYSINSQFEALSNLYLYVSNETRIMILATFMKLLKHDLNNKELKSKIIKFLQIEINSIDSELQQRSFEYLNLLQKLNEPNGEVLFSIVFSPAPVFNNKENPLLKRLSSHLNVIKNDNLKLKLVEDNLLDIKEEDEDPFSEDNKKQQQKPQILSPNWEKGYYRIFEFNQGIFFENSLIKIILRFNKTENFKNLFNLTITNKSPNELTSLLTSVDNMENKNPKLLCKIVEFPESRIPIDGKTSMNIEIVARSVFEFNTPNLLVQFGSGGGFNKIYLKLPIFLTKFIVPTELNFSQFLQHWKQIDTLGNQGESVKVITLKRDSVNLNWLTRFIEKLGFSIIEGKQTLFICGAGILTTNNGKFGTLMKVKIIDEFNLEFRIRATSPKISELLIHSIENYFKFTN